MIRPAMLVIALWAVMAAPVLCTAGALAHECHCEDEQVCEHESDCHVDPCGEILVRKDDPLQSFGATTVLNLAVSLPVGDGIDRTLPVPSDSPDRSPPRGLPHPSDSPLLS